ncbi:hypothetical protein NEMBOFW57_009499 [Staphylotrichum longicolle]|uniref:Uncharacterized protein n=1 Tax=Staphylotrichum longicolle TaxID=669026 RepID=A0AAD4HTG1_9PEZI|nr:hypothetical protein NEMBOFW57_009499 [Staphylotrichum longicolle]
MVVFGPHSIHFPPFSFQKNPTLQAPLIQTQPKVITTMRYLAFILAALPIAAWAAAYHDPPQTNLPEPEPADPPAPAPTLAICNDPPCHPEQPHPAPGCAPRDSCGAACCSQQAPFFHPHCANPAKSLCCLEGEAEVGNTGKCCPRGFVLLGGAKCCPPRSILCRGECCVGTCDPASRWCRPTITNRECRALGAVGAYATTPRSMFCCTSDWLGCCMECIH